MAGPGQNPETSTEQKTANDLVTGPHKNAAANLQADAGIYGPAPVGNANKTGQPEARSDAQAGGPRNPDAGNATAAGSDTSRAATTATTATDNRAATTATTATDNTRTTAAATTDKTTTTDAATAPKTRPEAFDIMHKVNDILDKDVPGLNKSHDLAGAQAKYEAAIALAKTLTPDDIAKAQADLIQVRKDKANEHDPEKLKALATKELDLYTITRLKDAAIGNMALWYYRQGKTEDGNAKLLEAAGVDPAKAQELKKMGEAETKAFGDLLTNSSSLSPILGDVNFYRQLNKIKQGGVAVPEVFGQINQAVIQHNAELAAAGRTSDNAAGNTATTAAGADRPAGTIDSNGDMHLDAATTAAANKANADISAFIELTKGFKDKPAPLGPLTDAQRKVMEDGLKGFDLQNKLMGQAWQAKQAALDAVIPADKQAAFGTAADAVSADLKKVADANGGKIPQAMNDGIAAVLQANTPEGFNTAAANLAKLNPDLSRDIQAAINVLPADKAAGAKAMQLYFQNSDLQSTFVATSQQQIAAHYEAARVLMNLKTPPDAADKAHANEIFKAAFTGVPPEISNQALTDPNVQKLANDVGFVKPAAAGSDAGAGTPAATTANANDLSALSVDDLKTRLKAAADKGPAGMTEAKALFEEEIRRAEDPARTKMFNDRLASNLTQLEQNKDASGQALDATKRFALDQENIQLISALSSAAQVRNDYATYLGDGRLNLNDESKAHAQIRGGLNQLKSQDEQQRKAIAIADAIDPNLLRRANAQINADRDKSDGEMKNALTSYKIAMEGGKDADGNQTIGLMSMRVVLRDQLAGMYLMQGKQFNDKGQLVIMPTEHKTDELFRPGDALKLINEAKAAHATMFGAGAHDDTTERLFAMGQQLNPETFKNASDALRSSAANGLADGGALLSSIGGSMVVKFAISALSEGKLNPAIVNRIGDGAAVVTGVLARHYIHGAITGKDESWTDSIVHGSVAALMPIGFKYGSKFLAESKVGAAINYRVAGFTGENVVGRVATELGDNATFSQVGGVFRRSGMNAEATALEALGSKPFSSATPEELAALNQSLNLNGARGRDALLKIYPNMEAAGRETGVLKALSDRGVKTVGDLEAQLATRAGRVTGMSPQLESDAVKAMRDGTPIKDALRKMTTGVGDQAKPLYSSEAAINEQANFLAENNINNLGQLRRAATKAGDFFTVSKLYPELAGLAPETTLAEVAAAGKTLGAAGTHGRLVLEDIAPEIAQTAPKTPTGMFGKTGSWVDKKVGWVGDTLWGNRFWKVDVGGVLRFPNAGKPASELVASEATGVRGAISNLKPEFGAPRFSNLTRLDAATASQRELQIASNSAKGWHSTLVAGTMIAGSNSAIGLYDNWLGGKSYQDSKGEWHKYTAFEALRQANFGDPSKGVLSGIATGTVGQALLGGFLLKGAIAPVLEESAVASQSATSWLGRRVPQLAYGRAAASGDVSALKTWGMYSIATPNVTQGAMDLMQARDKQKTVDNFNLPLTDYPLESVGSTADEVQRQQQQRQQQQSQQDGATGTTDTTGTTGTTRTGSDAATGQTGTTGTGATDNAAGTALDPDAGSTTARPGGNAASGPQINGADKAPGT